jgi:hypothetical protein
MARRFVFAGLLIPLIAALIGVGAGAASASKPEVQKGNGHGHEYPAKGNKSLGIGFGFNSNLVNHGGPILSTSSQVTAIYWGVWSTPGDKISGLDSFYTGWSSSGYSTTTTEYAGPGSTRVSGAVTYIGHVIDTKNGGPKSPPSTAQVLAEVASTVPTTVTGGYYAVYTDLKRGNAGYCAWHDTGIANGKQVEVAFFFNLDGDSGCNPNDATTGHSEGLAALANVSGHELSEAKTDPQLNAWYDRQGSENADKCAWTFHKVSPFPSNGTQWKIQGNWSNNAYNARTGYANRGCIDGNP